MSSQTLKHIALVGRPNVGKSTLFNRLTRSRKAVVRDEPGVTRDIQTGICDWWGRSFIISDTGGLSGDSAGLTPLIRRQVLDHLRHVDLIVMIVDGRAGLMPEDRDVFRTISGLNKPFVIVVNKCDRAATSAEDMELCGVEFYEFGRDIIPAAFERDFGIDCLVEWIFTHLGGELGEAQAGFRVLVLGKPNAGKSLLCNRLLGESRMLVSDIAGTTVDAIETHFVHNGENYILVDTAGLRRAGKQRDGTEVLGGFKTREAVRQADLILLVIDATEEPAHQDARLIDMCLEHHKPIIIVANKSDLGQKKRDNFREWFRERVGEILHFFSDPIIVFTSAKEGTGIRDLFARVASVREKLSTRIPTSKLNKFFEDVIKQAPSPVFQSQNVKFYYLTQTQQRPPSFIAFANHPEGVTPAYRRFLVRKIQENWDLKGIPLRIFVMQKG